MRERELISKVYFSHEETLSKRIRETLAECMGGRARRLGIKAILIIFSCARGRE